MASTILRKLYREARAADTGCIVGEHALSAWRAAHILRKWDALESLGYVQIRAEHDNNWEPDCDCGEDDCPNHNPDSEALGVIGEFLIPSIVEDYNTHGCRPLFDNPKYWTHADSVWGCVGYRDATDWKENVYVLDIMAETIGTFRAAWKDHIRNVCPQCHGTGRAR
jgi:hypothetical protein